MAERRKKGKQTGELAMRKRRFRRLNNGELKNKIPLLPNFVTTIGLFFGFFSMMFSLKGNFYNAAIMIILAGFIDGVDGRIARATNSTSAFGKEYDSLCDLVCFGVAPSVMVYLWALSGFGRMGFLAGFVYVACGALRLARFNTDTTGDGTKFTGLPIPVAAVTLASILLVYGTISDYQNIPYAVSFIESIRGVPILAGVFFLAFLMVSTIKYPSFKHITYIKAHPFQLLVAGVLLLMVVAYQPEIMAFLLTMTFVIGGIILNIVQYLFFRNRKAVSGEINETIPRENHNI
jgi:CDP-diacylglycerol---serine O-phosphatidyltransferase